MAHSLGSLRAGIVASVPRQRGTRQLGTSHWWSDRPPWTRLPRVRVSRSKPCRCRRVSIRALFDEEDIGGEWGEGFTSFRPTRGQFDLDVEYLNEKLVKTGRQRLRLTLRPDEAFAAIFSWEGVVTDTKDTIMAAWEQLAKEQERPLPTYGRPIHTLLAERVAKQLLRRGEGPRDARRMVMRLEELYREEFAKIITPQEGLVDWLQALQSAGVPCAVTTPLNQATVVAAMERLNIRQYFQAIVSQEDGMESMAQRFLSAAVKLDRPPVNCIVFEDDPRGITAAHNCTMKAVALIGTHPAYELKQADLTMSKFSELSVINLRRLFANQGSQFMDLKKEEEAKVPAKRRTYNDLLPPPGG